MNWKRKRSKELPNYQVTLHIIKKFYGPSELNLRKGDPYKTGITKIPSFLYIYNFFCKGNLGRNLKRGDPYYCGHPFFMWDFSLDLRLNVWSQIIHLNCCRHWFLRRCLSTEARLCFRTPQNWHSLPGLDTTHWAPSWCRFMSSFLVVLYWHGCLHMRISLLPCCFLLWRTRSWIRPDLHWSQYPP